MGNWNDSERQKQADLYYNLLKICLDAPNCESFSIWGVTDKQSNLRLDQQSWDDPHGANPLPFNWYGEKKAAYWAMRDLLASYGTKNVHKWLKHEDGEAPPCKDRSEGTTVE